MDEVDAWGNPAYGCAADGTQMVVVPDSPGVLRCPGCGRRTDEVGRGVLGDGFDVIHRQWGLRGDPHVWQALRHAVADEPTPADAAAVRADLAAALRRVADVDVDAAEVEPVHREQFAHGGMSSGMVDGRWWRDKGLPLIAERALARRPAPAPRRSSLLTSVLGWALILLIPVMTIGGGGWLLYQRAAGTPVRATVLACETSGNWSRYAPTIREECVARWTLDGETVVGGFNAGNGSPDVGKTVGATVRGDTAYSRSLVLPVILIGLGLPFLVPVVLGLRRRPAARSADR